MIDRLSIRERPEGLPLMHQHWGKLLFLHWPAPAEQLRRLVPSRLEIDTFAGSAWVSVTPFTMWGIRPVFSPPLPILSRSHELNVRTYVHLDGVPGVWFLSLDASNALAVWAARLTFHLPYYRARMGCAEEAARVRFRSRRTHPGAAPAGLAATWALGDALPEALPGTLEFFLIERYCLYASEGSRLRRARIYHRPWPLRGARLEHLTSSMLEPHGLPAPEEAPLVHAQAAPLHVEIWPPGEV